MATVLLSKSTNTFYGVYMSQHLSTVTRRSVHPASPVLLTKNGPLRAPIQSRSSIKQLQALTH